MTEPKETDENLAIARHLVERVARAIRGHALSSQDPHAYGELEERWRNAARAAIMIAKPFPEGPVVNERELPLNQGRAA